MRAPAIYIGTSEPWTFEITRFATGGMRSARWDRPYSPARRETIHGTPSDGKSVGTIDFVFAVSAFAAAAFSRIARRRLTGSAMFVARFTSVIVAWVVYSVLPGSRSDTGTAAISGFVGMPP